MTSVSNTKEELGSASDDEPKINDDDWVPPSTLDAIHSTPIPNEIDTMASPQSSDIDDEEWVPLSTLDSIPSTPILNKMGIMNPSPSAYYYLDIMTRNKKILFDTSIDISMDPFDDDFEATSFQSSNSRDSGLASSQEDFDEETCTQIKASLRGIRNTHNEGSNLDISTKQCGQKRCLTQNTVMLKKLRKDNNPRWRC